MCTVLNEPIYWARYAANRLIASKKCTVWFDKWSPWNSISISKFTHRCLWRGICGCLQPLKQAFSHDSVTKTRGLWNPKYPTWDKNARRKLNLPEQNNLFLELLIHSTKENIVVTLLQNPQGFKNWIKRKNSTSQRISLIKTRQLEKVHNSTWATTLHHYCTEDHNCDRLRLHLKKCSCTFTWSKTSLKY